MGKRASDRAGKCKTCGTAWNNGDQINLGKKPDGNWAVCPSDECYNKQIKGESVKPKITPNQLFWPKNRSTLYGGARGAPPII